MTETPMKCAICGAELDAVHAIAMADEPGGQTKDCCRECACSAVTCTDYLVAPMQERP
jgi:hypothetical protein